MLISGALRRLQMVMASMLAAGLVAACGGGGSDKDATCSDFQYQEDAQAALRDGAKQLDADRDGTACESLPHRPTTPSTSPPAVVQGLYSGTLTGSTSTNFQLLALENGDVWSLYGTPSGASFRVRGFIQGPTARNGSAVSSSSVKDFGFDRALAGSLAGTLTATTVGGTVTFSTGAVTFSGTAVPTGTYNYNAAATNSQVAGTWTLSALDGTSATVSVGTNGSFTGNNAGCAITGTILPRASGKNVFDVSVTSGPAPCFAPGTTSTGIALTSVLADGTTRQLIVAGVNAGRTAGNAFFGVK
jgi:hypothetical protein